jgi:hypothetical protein
MNVQNFKTIKVSILGLPFGNPREKCHLDVTPMENHKVYYKGHEWCLLPKVKGCVKLVFEVIHIKLIAPYVFNLQQLPFFLGCAG